MYILNILSLENSEKNIRNQLLFYESEMHCFRNYEYRHTSKHFSFTLECFLHCQNHGTWTDDLIFEWHIHFKQ